MQDAVSGYNAFEPWKSSIFNPPNPSDSAMPYYNKIPGMLQQYLGPYAGYGQQAAGGLNQYMNNGLQAGQTLQQQLGQLATNPSGVMNGIGSQFQQSPGYQFQVNQALGAANRAGAAGGMAGSPMEQQNVAGTVTGMANQDYYNYLNHGMDMYGMGLSGLQGMYGTGAGAAGNMFSGSANMVGDLASSLGSAYMNQGNLAYAGQANQNQMTQGMIGAAAGFAGGMA